MDISLEFIFQVLNTLLLACIPIIFIFIFVVIFRIINKNNTTIINNKISELEQRINKLENK